MRMVPRTDCLRGIFAVALAILFFGTAVPASHGQSGGAPGQSQQPANPQPDQDIPDAPSTVQPPPPKQELPPPDESKSQPPSQSPAQGQGQSSTDQSGNPPPPKMPPVQTLPPGTTPIPSQTPTAPRNQINPAEGIYTFRTRVNFVQVPVMVKDPEGHRVDGLAPKDFTLYENGKAQTLTFFTSDPFELSVAIVLDTGVPDVDLQKLHETYTALVGAFSPYDEVALYTYSSNVSQVVDFTQRSQRLTAALDEMKLEHGTNGPPVLDGPLAMGPTVNGVPVGGGNNAPVNVPDREFHVLNDAMLRAALDLGKRDPTRRKVIFVISDGREWRSRASYKDVLRIIESRNIQVKGVVFDAAAVPGVRWAERKFRLPLEGYTDILPKYCRATGGGDPFYELSRNAIEEAYQEITTDARNQYTLGYVPLATTGSSAYRTIEVVVHRRGLKVTAKDGYYPSGTSR